MLPVPVAFMGTVRCQFFVLKTKILTRMIKNVVHSATIHRYDGAIYFKGSEFNKKIDKRQNATFDLPEVRKLKILAET